MDLQPSTVRPGLMVALRTEITGNVSYSKKTLADGIDMAGVGIKEWNTLRTTRDPKEHDEAVEVRGRCRTIIARQCALTNLGCMLCRKENAELLDAAIKEARALANEFNSRAKLTRVSLNVAVGEIADNDVETMRSVNDNMRDLLRAMEAGVRNLDAEAIRKAASKAKSLSQMLTTQPENRVRNAIDQARKAARKLVKAGEVAAREVDRQAITALLYARTALVDLDAQGDIGDVEGESRSFDLQPTTIAEGVGGGIYTAAERSKPTKFEL